MLESLLNVLYRRRKLVLSAGIGLWLVALAFVPRLSLNDSPERWMPASSVHVWQRFDALFDIGDTIAVGIEFHRAVRDSDLDFLRGLRTDLEGSGPGIKRVYESRRSRSRNGSGRLS